jgi:hypothetical protein
MQIGREPCLALVVSTAWQVKQTQRCCDAMLVEAVRLTVGKLLSCDEE